MGGIAKKKTVPENSPSQAVRCFKEDQGLANRCHIVDAKDLHPPKS